jgi:hypothetical protein
VKMQSWIFSVRYRPEDERDLRRFAVVGAARASTVEAALHLAGMPEVVRIEVRTNEVVRDFVEGRLDPEVTGYYAPCPLAAASDWIVCIGSVQEVLS